MFTAFAMAGIRSGGSRKEKKEKKEVSANRNPIYERNKIHA